MASTSKGKARRHQEEPCTFLSSLDILQARPNYHVDLIKETEAKNRGKEPTRKRLPSIHTTSKRQPTRKEIPSLPLPRSLASTQIHKHQRRQTCLSIRTLPWSTWHKRTTGTRNTQFPYTILCYCKKWPLTINHNYLDPNHHPNDSTTICCHC